ncbi:hypothetical protein P7C70_g2732, partial [Phenoliferia sp. Uapishka_3]
MHLRLANLILASSTSSSVRLKLEYSSCFLIPALFTLGSSVPAPALQRRQDPGTITTSFTDPGPTTVADAGSATTDANGNIIGLTPTPTGATTQPPPAIIVDSTSSPVIITSQPPTSQGPTIVADPTDGGVTDTGVPLIIPTIATITNSPLALSSATGQAPTAVAVPPAGVTSSGTAPASSGGAGSGKSSPAAGTIPSKTAPSGVTVPTVIGAPNAAGIMQVRSVAMGLAAAGVATFLLVV